MSLHLGDTVPDFTADTTDGEISFHRVEGRILGSLLQPPGRFYSCLYH